MNEGWSSADRQRSFIQTFSFIMFESFLLSIISLSKCTPNSFSFPQCKHVIVADSASANTCSLTGHPAWLTVVVLAQAPIYGFECHTNMPQYSECRHSVPLWNMWSLFVTETRFGYCKPNFWYLPWYFLYSASGNDCRSSNNFQNFYLLSEEHVNSSVSNNRVIDS